MYATIRRLYQYHSALVADTLIIYVASENIHASRMLISISLELPRNRRVILSGKPALPPQRVISELNSLSAASRIVLQQAVCPCNIRRLAN